MDAKIKSIKEAVRACFKMAKKERARRKSNKAIMMKFFNPKPEQEK